jgi:capsular polysaccharide biosynthesis protein
MKTPLFARVLTAVRQQRLVVLCIFVAGVVAAALALTSSHPKYTATAKVLMVPTSSDTSSGKSQSSSTPLLSADLPALATDPTVLARVSQLLGSTSSVDELRSHIGAKASPDSSIMPVQFTDRRPDVAIRSANALSDEIVRFYREIATSRFDSLIADFNSQLATRRTELAKLDGELASAAKSYPYIDVSASGESGGGTGSVYGRLVAIRAERDALQATTNADAAAARATSRLISNAAPLARRDVINSDTAYLNVRDQYAKDFAALEKLSAFGNDRYPGIVELRATVVREAWMVDSARRHAASAGPTSNATYVEALDAQVRAEALYASDRAKLQAQDDQLDRLHAQIGQGSIATAVARVRRDHGSAEAAYAIIAARLAKSIADRSEAASTGSVIVLARATSASQAASPSGMVVALGILFLTVWLALTLAVMIDGAQEWFRDPQTVEAVYGTNLIGSIV